MICVLHGISFGLAIDISSCADVRLCAADTRFAVKEVDIGLAADIGTLSRLPRCVGSFSWVKDVCLSARTFDAREALAVGFVSRVLESKEAAVQAALGMAGTLAGKSPVAVQGTKEILNHARDHTVDESRLIFPESLSWVGGCVANFFPFLPLQVCGIPPSGTKVCSSRMTSLQRCCRDCRRGNPRSRNSRCPGPSLHSNPLQQLMCSLLLDLSTLLHPFHPPCSSANSCP